MRVSQTSRCCGPRTSRSFAATCSTEVAQHNLPAPSSPPQTPLLRPHRFQQWLPPCLPRHLPHRLPPPRQRLRQHHRQGVTPSIVLSALKSLGEPRRKIGVVVFITKDAPTHTHLRPFPTRIHPPYPLSRQFIHQCSPQHHRALQTRTIVRRAMPIGSLDGVSGRRIGAAVCMERVALARVGAVEPHLHHLIAKQGLQIGWQVGVWPKKHFVADLSERAAHQQQVDVRSDK